MRSRVKIRELLPLDKGGKLVSLYEVHVLHIAGEHTVSSNALQRLSTKRRARCRSFETRASFWIQSYARLSTADAECSAPGAFIRTGVSFGWRDWGRIRRARAIKEPRSQVKVNSRSARPAAEDYSFWKLLDIGRLTELGWRQSTSLAEGIRILMLTPSESVQAGALNRF